MKNLNNNQPQAKAQAKAQAQAEALRIEAEAQAEAQAQAEALRIEAELSKLLPSTETVKEVVITKRQELNQTVKQDVNGLGQMFGSLRRNKSETLAFLEDQKSKGKKIDVSKVRAMLYGGDFNLFRQYLNDKEREQKSFTPNQVSGIFLRACLAD
jgi:hypothetical protein